MASMGIFSGFKRHSIGILQVLFRDLGPDNSESHGKERQTGKGSWFT